MSEELVNTTISIVSAYVSNNSLRAEDLGGLLKDVHATLLQTTKPLEATAEAEKPVPAMPWRKTIHRDYLISLEDGKKYKTLKRHLTTRGMTLDEYRAKWGLPKDYPAVCADYSERRSALAKSLDLGHARKSKRDVSAEVETAIAKEVEAAPAKAEEPAKTTRAPRPHPKPKDAKKAKAYDPDKDFQDDQEGVQDAA